MNVILPPPLPPRLFTFSTRAGAGPQVSAVGAAGGAAPRPARRTAGRHGRRRQRQPHGRAAHVHRRAGAGAWGVGRGAAGSGGIWVDDVLPCCCGCCCCFLSVDSCGQGCECTRAVCVRAAATWGVLPFLPRSLAAHRAQKHKSPHCRIHHAKLHLTTHITNRPADPRT